MRGAEGLFFVMIFLDCWQGPPRQKTSKHSEFAPSSYKQQEYLARLFDDILQQAGPHVPFDEARAAGRSITKRVVKQSSPRQKTSKHSEFAPSSYKQQEYLGRLSGHISEKNEEPPLFHRAGSEQLTTVDTQTLKEVVKRDAQNRTVPCAPLLSFLQRNIVLAGLAVAGVLVAAVALLLALITCARKKQPLSPPAGTTYNIFIMNGKTQWLKSQEKNSSKRDGEQKLLNCDSCI